MLKKLCTLTLSLLLFQAALARPAAARTGPARDAAAADRVRAEVAKLGAGAGARVKVELLDGRKLEGHVAEAGAEHFVINERGGNTARVEYTQVKKVKGQNLSTGAKVGIGIGIGAGAALLIAYIAWAAAER